MCRAAATNPAILTSCTPAFIDYVVSDSNRVAQRLVRWVVVLVPLSWGVYSTLQKAAHLFH
jgi:hypothetical protein